MLDKDELDTAALRLVRMWRRKFADREHEVNLDAIGDLVDEAARALNRHTTIKRCHSTAGPEDRRGD